jgi:hypothetical protein
MELLDSETFDPTNFDTDFSLVVWFIETYNKIIYNLESVNNLDIYGIKLNESNVDLIEYYGIDISKKEYYMIYKGNELYQQTYNIDELEFNFGFEEA